MTAPQPPQNTDSPGIVRGSVGLGMSGHSEPTRGKNDEWLTPPEIIEALGPFDLDPCAPVNRPWSTAARHLTTEDDGLAVVWGADEFVWLNPPYGRQTWTWLDRLAHHAEHGRGGIALTFARTETAGFFRSVWGRADSVLFLEGRLHFHYVTGERAQANSGAPSCLVAYGGEATDRLVNRGPSGVLVSGWRDV